MPNSSPSRPLTAADGAPEPAPARSSPSRGHATASSAKSKLTSLLSAAAPRRSSSGGGSFHRRRSSDSGGGDASFRLPRVAPSISSAASQISSAASQISSAASSVRSSAASVRPTSSISAAASSISSAASSVRASGSRKMRTRSRSDVTGFCSVGENVGTAKDVGGAEWIESDDGEGWENAGDLRAGGGVGGNILPSSGPLDCEASAERDSRITADESSSGRSSPFGDVGGLIRCEKGRGGETGGAVQGPLELTSAKAKTGDDSVALAKTTVATGPKKDQEKENAVRDGTTVLVTTPPKLSEEIIGPNGDSQGRVSIVSPIEEEEVPGVSAPLAASPKTNGAPTSAAAEKAKDDEGTPALATNYDEDNTAAGATKSSSRAATATVSISNDGNPIATASADNGDEAPPQRVEIGVSAALLKVNVVPAAEEDGGSADFPAADRDAAVPPDAYGGNASVAISKRDRLAAAAVSSKTKNGDVSVAVKGGEGGAAALPNATCGEAAAELPVLPESSDGRASETPETASMSAVAAAAASAGEPVEKSRNGDTGRSKTKDATAAPQTGNGKRAPLATVPRLLPLLVPASLLIIGAVVRATLPWPPAVPPPPASAPPTPHPVLNALLSAIFAGVRAGVALVVFAALYDFVGEFRKMRDEEEGEDGTPADPAQKGGARRGPAGPLRPVGWSAALKRVRDRRRGNAGGGTWAGVRENGTGASAAAAGKNDAAEAFKIETVSVMREKFDHLPPELTAELSIMTDYILRDFVLKWYHGTAPSSGISGGSAEEYSFPLAVRAAVIRIFGTLSTAASERVNLPDLVLVKIVHALSKQIALYRRMRAVAEERDPGRFQAYSASVASGECNDRPDIRGAVAREFLGHNRMHSAITFGLNRDSGDEEISMAIMYDVLMKDNGATAAKCERDYLRVLGKRLMEQLLDEKEYSSPMIRGLLSEMFACSVLVPVMGLFLPEMMNGWLLGAINSMKATPPTQPEAPTVDYAENDICIGIDGPFDEDMIYAPGVSPLNCAESTTAGWNYFAGEVSEEDVVKALWKKSAKSFLIWHPLRSKYNKFIITYIDKDVGDVSPDTKYDYDAAKALVVNVSFVVNTDAHTATPEFVGGGDSKTSHSSLLELLKTMSHVLDLNEGVSYKNAERGDSLSKELTPQNEQILVESKNTNLVVDTTLDEDNILSSASSTEENVITDVKNDLLDDSDCDSDNYYDGMEVTDQGEMQHDEGSPIEAGVEGDIENEASQLPAEHILPLLKLSVGEIQVFTQRNAQDSPSITESPHTCDAACQLALLIDNILCDGIRDGKNVFSSYIQILMNVNAGEVVQIAENSIANEVLNEIRDFPEDPDLIARPIIRSASDVTLIRSLIASWLQTGELYKIMKTLALSQDITKRFYIASAFMRNTHYLDDVLQMLLVLDSVSVMISTKAVIDAESLFDSEPEKDKCDMTSKELPSRPNHNLSNINSAELDDKPYALWSSIRGNKAVKGLGKGLSFVKNHARPPTANFVIQKTQTRASRITMHHLNFCPYTSFVDHLRTERFRGLESFRKKINGDELSIISSSLVQQKQEMIGLHSFARLLAKMTVSIQHSLENKTNALLLEKVAVQRSIDIKPPGNADERRILPICVQENKEKPDEVYQTYAATYRVRINRKEISGYYIFWVALHYYPSDHTAIIEDPKWSQENCAFKNCQLPERFKNARAACRKPSHVTGTAHTFESAAFDYVIRQGRPKDFLFRINRLEKPKIVVNGKRFTLEDSRCSGFHRTNASSREVSDATISYMNFFCGESADAGGRLKIYLKDGNGQRSKLKPSAIRAALMVKSAQKEIALKRILASVNRTIVDDESTLQIQSMLKLASSKAGEEILLRDVGRPGLGCRRVSFEKLQRMGVVNKQGRKTMKAYIANTIQEQSNEVIGKPSVKHLISCISEKIDEDGNLLVEEWTVMRHYSDFVALHKQLKTQVTEDSPNKKFMKSKDKFGANVALLPTLFSKGAAVRGVGVGWKFVEQRAKLVDIFLQKITSHGHVLQMSTELMKFLSCQDNVFTDREKNDDVYSRTDYKCTLIGPVNTLSMEEYGHLSIFSQNKLKGTSFNEALNGEGRKKNLEGMDGSLSQSQQNSPLPRRNRTDTSDSTNLFQGESINDTNEAAFVISRLTSVKVKSVQDNGFNLVRQLFHLDNATFLRSRMIDVIRQMSFLVTGNQRQFTQTLIKLHTHHITAKSVAGLARTMHETMWPGGVFLVGKQISQQEKLTLERLVEKKLPSIVPEQLLSVLGYDDCAQGIRTFHEMLQNPLVLKSLMYMIMDLLWLEIFPELSIDLDSTNAIDDL